MIERALSKWWKMEVQKQNKETYSLISKIERNGGDMRGHSQKTSLDRQRKKKKQKAKKEKNHRFSKKAKFRKLINPCIRCQGNKNKIPQLIKDSSFTHPINTSVLLKKKPSSAKQNYNPLSSIKKSSSHQPHLKLDRMYKNSMKPQDSC